MIAQTLYKKFCKIKNKKQKADSTIEDLAYLNGWIDCAKFILKELQQ